jgi:hypothetical protein
MPNLRWWIFNPFQGYSLLKATLFLRESDYSRRQEKLPGQVLFFAQIMSFGEPGRVLSRPDSGDPCPPVPTEQWQDAFEAQINSAVAP